MPLTAEQAHFLLHNVFLPALKNETRTTKKILEAIPADKVSYQPDACAKTADELLRHIAVAENFFLEAPLNGAFDPGGVKIPDSAKTPAEVAVWYEQTVNRNLDALAKLSGEQLAKILDFRGLFQQEAVMFLSFGLVHGIHHRGQLSTYLRPMGSKVPAIYGESYDTAAAKKAAAQG
ncbi:MAG TPA: DinB family protein [Candidatus Binatia bacterium]